MAKKDKIIVEGTEIILLSHQKEDYISLTDMAKYKNAEAKFSIYNHYSLFFTCIRFFHELILKINNIRFNRLL